MKRSRGADTSMSDDSLVLVTADNKSGFKNVTYDLQSRRYELRVQVGGKRKHLGAFKTAREAAVVYARTAEGKADAAAQQRPTGADAAAIAVRAAEREGLLLIPADRKDSTTGYKNVTHNVEQSGVRKYKLQMQKKGKRLSCGLFGTAEEAALAYARTPEGRADAERLRRPAPVPRTAAAIEAVQQAEREGLTLVLSANATGRGLRRRHFWP